jgi:hypothetical protein
LKRKEKLRDPKLDMFAETCWTSKMLGIPTRCRW